MSFSAGSRIWLKSTLYSQEKKTAKKNTFILELSKELDLPGKIVEIARELSPLYTLTRYPDVAGSAPFKIYNKEKVSGLIKLMEEFMGWLEQLTQM
ncbi:MAG TPA: HEPN domain-containing protein [Nanoarchaeota archaeon]|nr:HEPN domain-containing protein [Nanoarchaeota archaeon]